MFLSSNKKNIDIFWWKKAPYQELCWWQEQNPERVQMARSNALLNLNYFVSQGILKGTGYT